LKTYVEKLKRGFICVENTVEIVENYGLFKGLRNVEKINDTKKRTLAAENWK